MTGQSASRRIVIRPGAASRLCTRGEVRWTGVPWVITQTDHNGRQESRQWTSRDVFRIRKSRIDSLGRSGERAQADEVIALLGGSPPDVLRDKAMILIGFAGAFRRPDLVGFRWSDVTVKDSGLVLRLRRSKTDRSGYGVDVGIPHGQSSTTDPVAALLAWREPHGTATGVRPHGGRCLLHGRR